MQSISVQLYNLTKRTMLILMLCINIIYMSLQWRITPIGASDRKWHLPSCSPFHVSVFVRFQSLFIAVGSSRGLTVCTLSHSDAESQGSGWTGPTQQNGFTAPSQPAVLESRMPAHSWGGTAARLLHCWLAGAGWSCVSGFRDSWRRQCWFETSRVVLTNICFRV